MKAAIQVDVDGDWTYRSYLGLETTVEKDELFAEAMNAVLTKLEEHQLPATFFVVGRDLQVDWKARILKRAARSGHEISNHSMNHILNFAELKEMDVASEIDESARMCLEKLGVVVRGFRAPGFDLHPKALRLLRARSYVYDSSVIPTFVYPLALAADRLFHLARGTPIPHWRHGPKFGWFVAPLAPYFPSDDDFLTGGAIEVLEVPVSTHPTTRIPIHMAFSLVLGSRWFEIGVRSLRRKGLPLVFLIHLKDFRALLDGRNAKALRMTDHVLTRIAEEFEPTTTLELAREWTARLAP